MISLTSLSILHLSYFFPRYDEKMGTPHIQVGIITIIVVMCLRGLVPECLVLSWWLFHAACKIHTRYVAPPPSHTYWDSYISYQYKKLTGRSCRTWIKDPISVCSNVSTYTTQCILVMICRAMDRDSIRQAWATTHLQRCYLRSSSTCESFFFVIKMPRIKSKNAAIIGENIGSIMLTGP